MLLWIKGALTPQEIRDKIMDPFSDFQRKIVEYLEAVHIGEFMTGSMDKVKHEVEIEKNQNTNYKDPTQTLPEAPPPFCDCNNCEKCENLSTWWKEYAKRVDDLILRSNVHDCGRNKSGKCKARFPRTLYDQTEVDSNTGALNVKKGEEWINTLSPPVTYLLRCNSDVTSLLSGTAIKAIVAYISDYVTKPGLKTYAIFDAIRSVFRKKRKGKKNCNTS
ncbi:uncharacterized protein LACBIDRAFT_318605 [Laccaria bicolor S238N-H82]|uniref:Predicted protein n=1 Tax=Laccaria bicolor (strain S238N-H82 / ATCC MYA-4686) TaxID=486041 RepID=B0D903_LACBS|nr:uncharacterized protein LACBIDRAFT_296516 [Laccaria bicolor S238N-H82]XP_001890478.1 uncharacterized protein LACBIDRAFT_318605 [Laccaria bicolor S238N-H82]EDQ98868.1 predicted protein [Laccaria bicolor S238N-H82]EDR09168.1 predicted protein [Laccaria bicolor S238N-H82]|eukprot:XP_001880481.1 predicted protein [Laccaria bicolor S238N-H82]